MAVPRAATSWSRAPGVAAHRREAAHDAAALVVGRAHEPGSRRGRLLPRLGVLRRVGHELRLAAVDGSLRIDSPIGAGTRVRAEIPFRPTVGIDPVGSAGAAGAA